MKTALFAIGVCALFALVFGCRTAPSVDTVYSVSYAAGTATALVMNETKLDADKRTVIRDIVAEIQACTPEVGQPLEAAWTPIARKHVDLLVEEGRIDSATAELIMAGFRTVMVGINLLEVRYPQIRSGQDYASAATSGFTASFLTQFRVDPDALAASSANPLLDREVVTEVRRAAIRNNLK